MKFGVKGLRGGLRIQYNKKPLFLTSPYILGVGKRGAGHVSVMRQLKYEAATDIHGATVNDKASGLGLTRGVEE